MHSKKLVFLLTSDGRQLVLGALPVSGEVEVSAHLATTLAVFASDTAAAKFHVKSCWGLLCSGGVRHTSSQTWSALHGLFCARLWLCLIALPETSRMRCESPTAVSWTSCLVTRLSSSLEL